MFNRDKLQYMARLDRNLTSGQKLILITLGSYAAPTGEVQVDRRRLSEETSIHHNTVSRYITSLVSAGWLQEERGPRFYRILVPDIDEVMAGLTPSPSRRSTHHRLELTEEEAIRLLSLCQEKESEITTLLTSGSKVADRRQDELTADADTLVDLQGKLSRFLSAYDWRGAGTA